MKTIRTQKKCFFLQFVICVFGEEGDSIRCLCVLRGRGEEGDSIRCLCFLRGRGEEGDSIRCLCFLRGRGEEGDFWI